MTDQFSENSNNKLIQAYVRLYQQYKAEPASTFVLEEDFDFIDFYAEQAFSGVDVETKFPAYFKKLMRSKALFDEFISALSQMEKDDVAHKLPFEVKPDLSFLKRSNPVMVQANFLSDWWSLAIDICLS